MGDVGETTDVEDRAAEATQDSNGADTNSGGIFSDSCTRDKASYAADWLLGVFLVFIVYLAWCEDPQRLCKNPQRFTNREQLIRKDQRATMHEKGNKAQKACKSPKGPPQVTYGEG